MVLSERQRSDTSRSAKAISLRCLKEQIWLFNYVQPHAAWRYTNGVYNLYIGKSTCMLRKIRDCSPLLWSYSLKAIALEVENSKKKCWFPSTREKKIEWTWGEQFVQVGRNYVTEVFWTTKLWYGQSNTSGQVRTDQRNIWFWWAFLSAFSVHRIVIWCRTFLFQVVCFSTANVKRVESFAQLSC